MSLVIGDVNAKIDNNNADMETAMEQHGLGSMNGMVRSLMISVSAMGW